MTWDDDTAPKSADVNINLDGNADTVVGVQYNYGGQSYYYVFSPNEADGGVRRTWPDDRPPYLGLTPFRQDDAEVFHGRDEQTRKLAEAVAQRFIEPGILMVTGPSGVGKSSVLLAGLLDHLARGLTPEMPESRRWPCRVMTPTQQPLLQLALSLAQKTPRSPAALREQLLEHPEEAHLFFRDAFLNHVADLGHSDAATHNGRLVLIVDQFEEIFTHSSPSTERERHAFLTALRTAAEEPVGPGGEPAALIVLGMRGDFWDRCAEYPQLKDACEGKTVSVAAMTEAELRHTIIGPAACAGLTIEDGLVELILEDLRTYSPPGAEKDGNLPLNVGKLPHLSQAMRMTWENSDKKKLTRQAYMRGGGVSGAIKHSADRAYAKLDDRQRIIADKALLQLAMRSPARKYFRLVATRQRLYEVLAPHSSEDVKAVIDIFLSHRLIVVDGDNIAVAHEELIRAWPHLVELLELHQSSVSFYEQINHDIEIWKGNDYDDSILYTGRRLDRLEQEIQNWAKVTELFQVTDIQRKFLRDGHRKEHRRTQLKGFLIGLLALFLVAIGGAGAGLIVLDHAAVQQSEIAASRGMIAQSNAFGENDPVRSRLLAAAALNLDPDSDEAQANAKTALARDGVALMTGRYPLTCLSISPDGKVMATGGQGNAVQLWDTATRRAMAKPLDHEGREVSSVSFSQTGDTLTTVDIDGLARVWDTKTHNLLVKISDAVTRWAPNPGDISVDPRVDDGNITIRGTDGNDVVNYNGGPTSRPRYLLNNNATVLLSMLPEQPPSLWNIRENALSKHRKLTSGEEFEAATFSRDGSTLASATDGIIQLWSVVKGQPLGAKLKPPGSDGASSSVDAMEFSPDGKSLAVSYSDQSLVRYDLPSGEQHEIGESVNYASALQFSSDGKKLAVGSWGGPGVLWDLTTPSPVKSYLLGHSSSVNAMRFSPHDDHLFTVSKDGSARAWDTTIRKPLGTLVLPSESGSAAFNNKGSMLAFILGSRIELLNMLDSPPSGTKTLTAQSSIKIVSEDHEEGDGIESVAFSPDDTRLAVITDGLASIWNLTVSPHKEELRIPLTARQEVKRSVTVTDHLAFSPNGKTLATSSSGNEVHFWDTTSGQLVQKISTAAKGPLTALVFSPDGKFLATAGNDNSVHLWNTSDGSRYTTFTGHTGPVSAVAFSHDSRSLVTAGVDSSILLWNVTDKKLSDTPPMHGDGPALSMSIGGPDGFTLAVGRSDGVVDLWDTRTGTPVLTFTNGLGETSSVIFSPSGDILVGIGDSDLAQFWDLRFIRRDPYISLCEQAGRAMTASEWEVHASKLPYREICQ